MKIKKRIATAFLSLCICVTALFALSLPVSAASFTPVITVSEHEAVNGDTVIVNVSITGNDGLMATTITIHYDNSALTYQGFHKGFLYDYQTVVDHGTYVSFVNCESWNFRNDGNLISLEFKVNDDAEMGFYPISVKNINPKKYGDSLDGCFAEWAGRKIKATAVAGGVNIRYNGNNCTHSFGEWEDTVPAQCETAGIRSHNCTKCGHNEIEETAALGHTYSENWTVDQEATAEVDGTMSRHCIRCDKSIDRITFSLDDSKDNGFSNSEGTELPPASWKPLEEMTEKEDEKEEEIIPDEPKDSENDSNTLTTGTSPEYNAEELLNNTQNSPKGIFERIWNYLFGTNTSKGVLEVIKDAPPESLRDLSPLTALLLLFL